MMRVCSFVIAMILLIAPAAAQDWREYSYPESFFAVSFPAEPKFEKAKYRAANGTLAEARIYSVQQEHCAFKMTVADLSGVPTEPEAAVTHAIDILSRDGKVKVDLPHFIYSVTGRQLSITGNDGKHSSVAVFYYKKRLYQLEGVALQMGTDGTADAIRFQQSLVFR